MNKQIIKKIIENLKRNESMEGVSTATEIRTSDHNHIYNQVLNDVLKKLEDLEDLEEYEKEKYNN